VSQIVIARRTTLPLLRARLPIAAILPIALAADTVSIAIMELTTT
jgi:hypothetical protein